MQTATKKETVLGIRQMAMIGVMTAVTCIAAPFSIPIPVSPVPLSLTTFILYLSVYILGTRNAFISYVIYLLGDVYKRQVLGTLVCYLFGTVWLCLQLNLDFIGGLGVGVIPYLPGDTAKIILAALIGPVIVKALKRAE